MKFLEFLKISTTKNTFIRIILLTILASLSNVAVIALINGSIKSAEQGETDYRFAIMFVIAIVLYFFSRNSSQVQIADQVEKSLRETRLNIVNKLRFTELSHMEKIGKEHFYTRLTSDTEVISTSVNAVTNGLQGFIMLIFLGVYMYFISHIAFGVTIITIAIGSLHFFSQVKSSQKLVSRSFAVQRKFFVALSHLLDGFKEVKLSVDLNKDLYYNNICERAYEYEEYRSKANYKVIYTDTFMQGLFYIMPAVLIFLVPMISHQYEKDFTQVVTSVLFIGLPAIQTIFGVDFISRAEVGITMLRELEDQLESIDTIDEQKIYSEKFYDFKSIKLQDVTYEYLDKEGNKLFNIGPVNLEIRQGETIILTGGNGSGKSTLMKVLTGLYQPVQGRILVDDHPIKSKKDWQVYRELFSAIFTDFHLFDRLYGLEDVDEAYLWKLLKLFKLDKKTAIEDGAFSSTDLSTGQRKRLAMIVTYLSDKPFYVLDEWAADQDPGFREYYYNEILQELKNKGKTIVAVSHDDRYFEKGDRLLKMTYGKLEGKSNK